MASSISGPAWRPTLGAFAVAALILGAISAALYARVDTSTEASGRPPLPVAATTYHSEDSYLREQRFLGLVQAGARSSVGFEVPGAIERILVGPGDKVAPGAVLATLDQQALAARRAAAQAAVTQIDAELELAVGRTGRQRPLAESGAISAQTFDDTRLAQQALAARLQAVQAQLRAIDVDLEKSTLRAPYAAVIAERLLDEGAVTQPGMAVFSLVSRHKREAHIGVAVEQAQRLQPGEHYELSWRGETRRTTLRAIRPDVNPVSMTAVAIFDLPAALSAFDGEPVAVSLPQRVRARGGWLPLSALLEGERGVWTVLRLDAAGNTPTALREVVEVLHTRGDQVYVRGTLSDGDRVIADGVHRIAPGTRVRLPGA